MPSSILVAASTGEIRAFVRGSLPDGWLPCDGRVLAISRHLELFQVIGSRFGGDGQSTFALPDLLGRVPVHPNLDPNAGPVIVLGQQRDLGGQRGPRRPLSPVVYAIAAPDHRRRRRGNAFAEELVVGEVRLFAGEKAPWAHLPCDGQSVRFERQPVLGAVLEGVYGNGGCTGFTMPDFRGRALAGRRGQLPGPLGERWLDHGRQGLATLTAAEAGAVLGITHTIATAGRLPLETAL